MTHDAEQRIRDRAYHLWESAGRPHGRDHEFWEQARQAERSAAAPPVNGAVVEALAAKPAQNKARQSNAVQSATDEPKSASAEPAPAKDRIKKRGSGGKSAR